MRNFLKLIRIQNLLIIAFSLYLIRFAIIKPILGMNGFAMQLNEWQFFMVVLASWFISAAGYVINDYFDTKADMVNHPENVIVGVRIKRRIAILLHTCFNIAGLGLALYISLLVGQLIYFFISILITLLLWAYSARIKNIAVWGNILVSFITGLVPLVALLAELPLLRSVYQVELIGNSALFNALIYWCLGFSFFAFLSNFIRELVKDIEDLEGDRESNASTMPIKYGVLFTRRFVCILIAIHVMLLIFVAAFYLLDLFSVLYIGLAIILPFILLMFLLVKAREKKHFHFISLMLKLIMLAGLLYAPLAILFSQHNFLIH